MQSENSIKKNEMMAEMLHTKARREQLSSKGDVPLLWWLQGFWEKKLEYVHGHPLLGWSTT